MAIGDVFLPMAERYWGTGSSGTVAVALLGQWLAAGTAVASVGLVGLFPSGRPERGTERAVIRTLVLVAVLSPLLNAVTSADIAMTGGPSDGTQPIVHTPLAVPVLAPLRGPAAAVYHSFPFWALIACGSRCSVSGGSPTRAARQPPSRPSCCPRWRWAPRSGPVLTALFYTGAFGIDEPARRASVHRVLRVVITAALAVAAVTAGAWSMSRTAGFSVHGWPATPTSTVSAPA